MKYVYLIQSIPYPDKKYIGVTQDLKARLKSHNEGQSSHTSKFKPWKIVTYIAFSNESKAVEFEKYLKSGITIRMTAAITRIELARRRYA